MLPGLARRDEADAGVIRHALRVTVPVTQEAYIHPATHWASSNTNPDQPPMGLRLRLKASYDISRLHGQARVVAQAPKTYGALAADTARRLAEGVTGARRTRWNDDDLNGPKIIPRAPRGRRHEPVAHGYEPRATASFDKHARLPASAGAATRWRRRPSRGRARCRR